MAGSDKGDDGWGVLHKSMMEVFRLGGSLIEEKSGTGQGEGVSGEKTIRVALDATAIGRGKTGNETYLRGLLEGWGQVWPEGIELTPIVSEPSFAPKQASGGAVEGWACSIQADCGIGVLQKTFMRPAPGSGGVESGLVSRGVLDEAVGERALCSDCARHFLCGASGVVSSR